MPFDSSLAPDGTIVTGTANAANVDLLGPFETSQFSNLIIQLTGTWSATVAFQSSNDEVNPTNWINTLSTNTTTGALAATATSTNTMWYVPAVSRWFRLRVTAYTSGTINAACLFSDEALPLIQNSSVTISGSTSVATKTTGGATNSKVLSAATTNATSVKASAGTIHGFILSNTTASYKYFKIYAKASAPVVGTDVPIATWGIPPNESLVFASDVGMAVGTGIAYAITGASADADATAVAVGDVTGNLLYA